ncbi:hypothetical protein RZS28_00895 [Methylocapsa polymorpha]|uniref:HTH cro/C1-type domain-containing protein n=1 Tax=Methylocapsa polymorpha TaxID=3080828 RepID=A0ABZ0HSL5_9HYPH|nr:hypothetical protein RZS28_00895 [Methylocapsa sp. RX1]
MARAALKMGVREVAALAQVSPNTITRIEADLPSNASTISVVRSALEAAGVIFVEENGEGAGVRLKKHTETVANLTGQIDALKADMTPEPANEKPSPKKAMKQLRRAHDQNELVELKNRRTKARAKEKK